MNEIRGRSRNKKIKALKILWDTLPYMELVCRKCDSHDTGEQCNHCNLALYAKAMHYVNRNMKPDKAIEKAYGHQQDALRKINEAYDHRNNYHFSGLTTGTGNLSISIIGEADGDIPDFNENPDL